MSNDPFSLAFFLPLLCCEIRIKSNSAIVVTFCMVMHCADSVGVFFLIFFSLSFIGSFVALHYRAKTDTEAGTLKICKGMPIQI